jgi:hypothetical protein
VVAAVYQDRRALPISARIDKADGFCNQSIGISYSNQPNSKEDHMSEVIIYGKAG